ESVDHTCTKLLPQGSFRPPSADNAGKFLRSPPAPRTARRATRAMPGSPTGERCATGICTHGKAITIAESQTVPFPQAAILNTLDSCANPHPPIPAWPHLWDREALHAPGAANRYGRHEAMPPAAAAP